MALALCHQVNALHPRDDRPAAERDILSQGLCRTREGAWAAGTARRWLGNRAAGRLCRGDAEPHSTSVQPQGNGFFLLITLHENP